MAEHKYWYDILATFKTEMLWGYAITLLFLFGLAALYVGSECNRRQTEVDKYDSETDRLHREQDEED